MFQPIYCNVTRKLVKAEALLRWNSSRFGPISPGTFIPIAEETDFINDLGNFVINETGKAVKEFIEVTNQQDIVISLNMSLRQLKNQCTISILENAVEKWKIDRKNLLVEITESSIMDDSGACVEMLHRLQQTGYSLAIDDFGTGYSSLATLASLPFDCLKIDKRFVDGIGIDKKQEDVLETIVRLARALNLQIVAEGIEQEPQWQFLAGLGVEYSQGYYFARPLPFEEFVLKAKQTPKAA
jgi:EAL domain-containing protein (putative c-di-GMP-specific phosphodiesterase class I)